MLSNRNDDFGSIVEALLSAAPASAPFAESKPYARCLNARLFEKFQNDGLLVVGKFRKYSTIGTHDGKLATTGESQVRRIVVISEADAPPFGIARAAAAASWRPEAATMSGIFGRRNR
jgi:hypothetical protein